MSIIKKLIITIVVLVILAGVGWVGISIYATLVKSPFESSSAIPEKEEAKFTVLIENTNYTLLTAEYEHTGNIYMHMGNKYILHGFWELIGQDWKYRPTDLMLDESIFGKITIKRR